MKREYEEDILPFRICTERWYALQSNYKCNI